MAIKLSNKPNTIAISTEYPYGDIRNIVGSTPGTPVSREVYADFHQFFERMMAVAGIAHNGDPDNNTNSFQLFEALLKTMNNFNREYTFTVSQTFTYAPVIESEFTNSLGVVTPIPTRIAVGKYYITWFALIYDVSFHTLRNGSSYNMGEGVRVESGFDGVKSRIWVYTYDSAGVLADGILDNYCITLQSAINTYQTL